MAHDGIHRDEFLVEKRVELQIVKFERISWWMRLLSVGWGWHWRHDDMGDEGASEGYDVAVGVLVCPDSCIAFNHRVAMREYSLSGTIEGQGHGFDARLSGDEKKTRENWDTDFCGGCMI
jgi:hypothetical protein